MVSPDEMYLSLVEINISLQRLAVNRKDTNTSLSVLQKNKTPDARALWLHPAFIMFIWSATADEARAFKRIELLKNKDFFDGGFNSP